MLELMFNYNILLSHFQALIIQKVISVVPKTLSPLLTVHPQPIQKRRPTHEKLLPLVQISLD